MNKFADLILRRRKTVLLVFVLFAAASLVLMGGVGVNYDLADYLPKDAPSTLAYQVMQEQFGEALPNVSVMIPEVSIPRALELKREIAAVPGVLSVLWLDDTQDITLPEAFMDRSSAEAFYKDGSALFTVTAGGENLVGAVDEIRRIAGEFGALAGSGVEEAFSRASLSGEMLRIVLIVLPLGIIILALATRSWLEPFLFLLASGIAIAINEGTNLIFGEVSYITRATSAILQMAVSMDYAVFLLHDFTKKRVSGLEPIEAMRGAIIDSAASIASSGLTTVMGFIALCMMSFRIGADLGIVLAKGVFLSLLSIMIFLPALVIVFIKPIDKTQHRSLMPPFGWLSRFVSKAGPVLLIAVALAAVPSFLAQRSNTFMYGSSGMADATTIVGQDAAKIEAVFPTNTQMALMVPRGEAGKELLLHRRLEDIRGVMSVVSYVSAVDFAIPREFIDPGTIAQLQSEEYSRYIITVDTPREGVEAFAMVDEVYAAADEFYPGAHYLVGESVNLRDVMGAVTRDTGRVALLGMLSIGLIIMLVFRSFSLPVLLVLTIEMAIWLNLSLPYYSGSTLNYIGYLVVSSVQLGATVDYGILLSGKYLEYRRSMGKKEAMRKVVADNAGSVLTPTLILVSAGMSLGLVSRNGVVSEMGMILGRGAAISAAMVLLVLPTILYLFDGIISKTTMKTSLLRAKSRNN